MNVLEIVSIKTCINTCVQIRMLTPRDKFLMYANAMTVDITYSTYIPQQVLHCQHNPHI